MRFSRKVGRPKKTTPENDKGTPELQNKRISDLTTEAIVLCQKRGIITDSQFIAGGRLRWLYNLRFGTPEVQAYDPHIKGRSCELGHNEKWLKARHDEYGEAISKLEQIRAKTLVMNICVFRQKTFFLNPQSVKINSANAHKIHSHLSKFKEGMELIEDLFKKK